MPSIHKVLRYAMATAAAVTLIAGGTLETASAAPLPNSKASVSAARKPVARAGGWTVYGFRMGSCNAWLDAKRTSSGKVYARGGAESTGNDTCNFWVERKKGRGHYKLIGYRWYVYGHGSRRYSKWYYDYLGYKMRVCMYRFIGHSGKHTKTKCGRGY